MFYESLNFLAAEVNNYLDQKLNVPIGGPRLKIGNVSRALDSSLPDSSPHVLKEKAILSLVNIEEDRIARQHENFTKSDTTTIYQNPPVFVNLYILFSINKDDYKDSLIWLSYIMQFFQYQNTFTPLTHPALDSRIEKLMVDLYTMNFEQVNHLWSTLGGKYLPSVLYKVRQVTLNENVTISESSFIKEIQLNEKGKQPVS